jgi:MurNAc alpha-1-phosphate uridylyltransferase
MPLPLVLPDDSDGHLILVPKPAYRDQGDFDLTNGRVANAETPPLTFSGIAVYRPEFFAECEPGRFPLAPMLRNAADASRLTGSIYNGAWEDVGTPQRLEELNAV